MYVPRDFAEHDGQRIEALIRDYPFASLVTAMEGRPFVTHLPLMLDGDVLLGHMARANPQWRDFDGAAEALAVFHGPHAYVSPRWYGVHPSVPTWNYAVVHVYGAPRIIDEAARTHDILVRLIAVHEGDDGWSMAGLPDDYVAGMIRGVVAFEMPVARIEAKAKLSQNRTAGDRRRVADALAAGGAEARATAALMRAREPEDA